jgi:hypothetical protein
VVTPWKRHRAGWTELVLHSFSNPAETGCTQISLNYPPLYCRIGSYRTLLHELEGSGYADILKHTRIFNKFFSKVAPHVKNEKSCGSRWIFFGYESGFSDSSGSKLMNKGERYRYLVG